MLLDKIKEVHKKSKQRYGSPRITKELKEQGTPCSENRIAKIMSKNKIRAKTKRKFKATTNSKHNYPVAPNLLNQRFTARGPNQIWVTDITYVWTREGWLYFAGILDLYSRQIVGWALEKRQTKALVEKALMQAILRRKPPKGILHHSDQGSQYASDGYQKLLHRYGFIPSMSRQGNCYDNAVMESFFRTLKTELVYFEDYQTRNQARNSIFEYIEIFYNRQRKHSSLGYLSPVTYETLYPVA